MSADEAKYNVVVAYFLVQCPYVTSDIYTVIASVFATQMMKPQARVLRILQPETLAFFELISQCGAEPCVLLAKFFCVFKLHVFVHGEFRLGIFLPLQG